MGQDHGPGLGPIARTAALAIAFGGFRRRADLQLLLGQGRRQHRIEDATILSYAGIAQGEAVSGAS